VTADPDECTGCVYVIWAESGQVKVGQSVDAWSRLEQLRSASPASLSLAFVGDCEEAVSVERKAHERLRDFHLHHEWFTTSNTVAIEAITSAAAELGHDIWPVDLAAVDLKARRTGSVCVNFTIDPELLQRLNDFCKRQSASRSAIIRRGIEMMIDAEPEKKPDRKHPAASSSG
jgi:T5orf172 domain